METLDCCRDIADRWSINHETIFKRAQPIFASLITLCYIYVPVFFVNLALEYKPKEDK